MNVLVVDSDSAIRELVARWLAKWGYQVRQAGKATEALEATLEEPARIIFCNMDMPGHDGLWLVERLHGKWPKAVIVVTSGVDDLETVARARREGVIDYVRKPFGRALLLQALHRAETALTMLDSEVA